MLTDGFITLTEAVRHSPVACKDLPGFIFSPIIQDKSYICNATQQESNSPSHGRVVLRYENNN